MLANVDIEMYGMDSEYFYTVIYAIARSLGSRRGNVSPVNIPIFIIIKITEKLESENLTVTIASYIIFITPLAMFVHMAVTDLSTLGIILSTSTSLFLKPLFFIISSKIYQYACFLIEHSLK